MSNAGLPTLDMSKSTPLNGSPSNGNLPSLDMSKSKPIDYTPPAPQGPSASAPPPPQDEGFLSRAYEETLQGPVNLAKATLARPIDLYHEMVGNAQKGDFKAAAESANKLLSMPITAGLNDKDSPLRKAATQIIMQPVDNLKTLYAQHQKAGQGKVSSAISTAQDVLDPVTGLANAASRVVPKVKADIHSGNYAGAVGDVLGGANTPATGAIPLVGGAVQQVAGNLDKDMHDHNYAAVLGDVTGPLATMGIGKILGAIGEGSEAASGAASGAEAEATPTTGAPPPPAPGASTTGVPPPAATPTPSTSTLTPGTAGVRPATATVAGQDIPVGATSPSLAAQPNRLARAVASFASKEGAAKFVAEQTQPAVVKALGSNFAESGLNSLNELKALRGDEPISIHPGDIKSTDDLVGLLRKEAKPTYSKLDEAAGKDQADWDAQYGPDSPHAKAVAAAEEAQQTLGPNAKVTSKIPEAPERPQTFTEMQDELNDYNRVLKSKDASITDKAAAKQIVPKLRDRMASFLNSHADVVEPGELSAANKTYAIASRYDYIADRLRAAVKGIEGGNITGSATKSISPTTLENLPDQFDNHFEPGDFKKLLGPEGMKNYNDISRLLAEPKTGSTFLKFLNSLSFTDKASPLGTPLSAAADNVLFNPAAGQKALTLWKGVSNTLGKASKTAKAAATTSAGQATAAKAATYGALAQSLGGPDAK